MKKTYIESIGVYLPGKRLTTDEIIDGCKVRPAVDLEEITGIRERREVSGGEYTLDLAINATSRCLEISAYGPEDIEAVICCNISRFNGPDYQYDFEPSSGVGLLSHFDFKNAITFYVNNACAGMFTAINVLDSMIKAGFIRRGMVVSGEYVSILIETAQREMDSPIDPQFASLTVGDSGAAIILDSTEDEAIGFHNLKMLTMAEYCDLCIGAASKQDTGGFSMKSDAVRMHQIAVGKSARQVSEMLEELGWKDDRHFLIPHQTSSRAIGSYRKAINLELGTDLYSKDSMVCNVAYRGNTGTTSHFVALWDLINEGKINPGDRILFGVQASGLVFGLSAYTLDDLPERVKRKTMQMAWA